MCGLAGFARHPDGREVDLSKEIFTHLLVAAQSRGRQATGIAYKDGKHVGIYKVAVDASRFVKSDPYNQRMAGFRDRLTILMGHTRNATHGNGHRDEAAHPFREGKVIGAHNGIITNWREIEKKLDRKDIIVDSQAAFALIDKTKDLKNALDILEGYFALTWIKGDELTTVRSSDAPLACAYVGEMRTLFWHSEIKVLETMINAAGLKDKAHIFESMAGMVYRYDPNLFTEKSANVSKFNVELKGTKSRWAYQKYGGVTSGVQQSFCGWEDNDDKYFQTKGHTVIQRFDDDPKPRPKVGQESLSDLRWRIESLEVLVKKMAKALSELIPRTESNEQEIEYLMGILDERGLLGPLEEEAEEVIDQSQVCAICGDFNDAKGGVLVDYRDGSKVHDTCLFTRC